MNTSRLRWQCRRGMRELDTLLVAFLEQDFPSASDDEKAAFEALLRLSDPELIGYVLGRETCEQPELNAIVERIRR